MNPSIDFRKIQGKLRELQPDDPHTLMLRAVFDDELKVRFQEFKTELVQYKTERIVVTRAKIDFFPYLPSRHVTYLMHKYFGTRNNRFPFLVPPPFWGEHFV